MGNKTTTTYACVDEEYLTHAKGKFLEKWRRPCKSDAELDDFDVWKTLGIGGYGRVYLVRKKSNENFYAMKVQSKDHMMIKPKRAERMKEEKFILDAVDFPFLIQKHFSFKDNSYLYLVFEFIPGGNLSRHVKMNGSLPEGDARFYGAQIVLALEYLHFLNIIHRDLKLGNLLLDQRGYIKVIDYGMSKRVLDESWTFCGTPNYLAPEMVQQQEHNKAVDWWAFGVVLFKMTAGKQPFVGRNKDELHENIVKAEVKYPKRFSSKFKDLLQSLFQRDPKQRLGNLENGTADVKAHKWFRKANWGKIFEKKKTAPFIPEVSELGSCENFDTCEEEDLPVCNIDKYPGKFDFY